MYICVFPQILSCSMRLNRVRHIIKVSQCRWVYTGAMLRGNIWSGWGREEAVERWQGDGIMMKEEAIWKNNKAADQELFIGLLYLAFHILLTHSPTQTGDILLRLSFAECVCARGSPPLLQLSWQHYIWWNIGLFSVGLKYNELRSFLAGGHIHLNDLSP